MGFLVDLVREREQPWLFVELPSGAPNPEFDHEALTPGETYVEIWLESMQIINSRKLFVKFFPALTSEITVIRSGGDSSQFFVVSSPAGLRTARRGDMGRVLVESVRLAGPLPYRGGSIGIDLGLFRLKAKDFAQPYIGLLTEMAIAAGIAFSGPAAPFAAPLVHGLNGLMQAATREGLEIGLSRQFRNPSAGLFALIGQTKQVSVRSRISLTDNMQLCLDGIAIKGIPYIIFSIQRVSNRYDWRKIRDVGESYRRARQALEPGGRPGELSGLLAEFERTARLSDDLIASDAEHLITEVRKQFAKVSQSRELTAVKSELPIPPQWEELPIGWQRPRDLLGRKRQDLSLDPPTDFE